MCSFEKGSVSSSQPKATHRLNLIRWLGGILVCIAFEVGAADPTNVKLAWDPSPDKDIAGYRIYYGTTPSHYPNSIVVGNVTNATVSGLTNGVAYYFAIAAYTTNDMQSAYSNEVTYKPAFSQLLARMTAARQMVLTILGQPGHVYAIEATQNLSTWSVIGNATPGAGGSVDFTDANAASFPRRFYRLRDTTP